MPTYFIEGYVYEKGNPVVRQIYLYDRSTGVLVDSTVSSGGYYYVETSNSGSHFIVCLDDSSGVAYDDLIIGNVYPEEVV
jgi:hypothetical protein